MIGRSRSGAQCAAAGLLLAWGCLGWGCEERSPGVDDPDLADAEAGAGGATAGGAGGTPDATGSGGVGGSTIPDASPDALLPDASAGGAGGGGQATLDVQALGEVPLDAQGRTELISFELPGDAISLTIVAQGQPGAAYVVLELHDPDGQALITESPPGVQPSPFIGPFPGPMYSVNRAVMGESMATALVPGNPDVTLTPGSWALQIAGAAPNNRPASGVVDLQLIFKRSPQRPTSGTLAVHCHFTGSRGWTAESAPNDPDFQTAIDRMRGFYEAIGVRIDEITYTDIDESFRVIDSIEGADNELSRLYALSSRPDGVSLFFVERFVSPFGGAIGGISGGVPGPLMQAGTTRSGVAISTEIDPDPRAIGHVMGHETGHYLGLFHTTEIFLGLDDQIDDTPRGQAGDRNLMFPTVTAGEASLSAQQGWVLHGSPPIVDTTGDPP